MDFNTGARSGARSLRPGGGGFDYPDPVPSFLNTTAGVLFSPRTFFRGISNDRRGIANPLIFATTCVLIGAVLSTVFGEVARVVPGERLLATQTGLLSATVSDFIYGIVGFVLIIGLYHLLDQAPRWR